MNNLKKNKTMKTLKYVFLFAIILCNLNHNVMCQIHIDTISSSYYKGITQHPPKNDYDRLVKEYLINKGEIKEDKESSIYVYELLNSNMIKDNNCGIYKIGTFSDHSFTYLFLIDKDKDQHIFLDFENLSETINAVLEFLDNSSCIFTDTQKLSYLRKIIEINSINKNVIPW